MASLFEKKSEQVAVKLAPQTLKDIEEICRLEDRPVGYIVRELMLRGLSLYQQDGKLRDVSEVTMRQLKEEYPIIRQPPKQVKGTGIGLDADLQDLTKLPSTGRTQKIGVLKENAK